MCWAGAQRFIALFYKADRGGAKNRGYVHTQITGRCINEIDTHWRDARVRAVMAKRNAIEPRANRPAFLVSSGMLMSTAKGC